MIASVSFDEELQFNLILVPLKKQSIELKNTESI